MAAKRFVVEPLESQHDRTVFACGVEPLDRYFRHQASQDLRNHLAAVFVLVEATPRTVAGYYTLSAAVIDATSLPTTATKRLGRYPTLPASLIGRLAIATAYQGQGLGTVLLFDALKRSFRSKEEVGAMAVLVDAKDDAARAFYAHHGFQQLLDQEYRLYATMRTIEQLLQAVAA